MKKTQVMTWMIGCAALLIMAGCGKIEETTRTEETEQSQSQVETQESVTDYTDTQENTEWHFGTQTRLPEGRKSAYQKYFYYVPDINYDYVDGANYIILKEGPNQAALDKINQDIVDTYYNMQKEPLTFQGSEIYKRIYPYQSEEYSAYYSGVMDYAISVHYFRYMSFLKEEANYDDYHSAYKSFHKTYDLNTGEELKLKDLFYEDTDYMTLLNEMIAEWEITNSDFGEREPFAGITEDQQFYLMEGGGLAIALDSEKDEYFHIYGDDLFRISAIGSRMVKEQLMAGNFDPTNPVIDSGAMYLPWSRGNILEVQEDLNTSYCGVQGLDEKVLCVIMCDVPEPVMETIKKLPIYDETMVEPDAAEYIVNILGDNLTDFTRQILITRTGPVYRVSVEQRFDVDYQNWEPAEGEQNYIWENGNKWNSRDLIIDAQGNIVDPKTIFIEDSAVLLAEKLRKYWQDNAYEIEWMQQNLDIYPEETLVEMIPDMEVSLDTISYNLISSEESFSIPWDELYPYLK